MSYDTEETKGWRLKDQPKSRGLTRVIASNGFLFQAVFSFLSPISTITRTVQQTVKPPFPQCQTRYARCFPGLSIEDSSGSSGSATPDEDGLRHVMDRIELMRQEFEELLFLKYAAEMLKDFRKRLLQERWD